MDNLTRVALQGVPDFFGFSSSARRIERLWDAQAECLADARAVDGSPDRATHLASALVKVARLEAPRVPSIVAWSTFHQAALLETRVRLLIEQARSRAGSRARCTTFAASLAPSAWLPPPCSARGRLASRTRCIGSPRSSSRRSPSRPSSTWRGVHTRRQAVRGDERARPRPLEIEPAQPSVDVQHFANQIESGTAARSHGRRVDLAKVDAARRGLGIVVAACLVHRERPGRQRADQPPAVVAREMRQRCRRVDVEAGQERGRPSTSEAVGSAPRPRCFWAWRRPPRARTIRAR